jgi:hypothetical protein
MQTTVKVAIFDKVHRLETEGVAHVTSDEKGIEVHLPIQINICLSHEDLRKLVSKLQPALAECHYCATSFNENEGVSNDDGELFCSSDCLNQWERDRGVARAESRYDLD